MTLPLQIGVTGGIGSGKSTVCAIFESLGIPLYVADDRAKWLMQHDARIREAIVERYGEEAYAGGQLNRAYLSEKVFHDEAEVAYLNQLVHPVVGEDYEQWVKAQQGVPYIVREAAIMLEKGYHEHLHAVINVAAPPEERLLRVLLRDEHRNQEQVEAIMAKQLSEEERKKKAQHTIRNYGTHMLVPQVLTLDRIFRKAAETAASA